MNTTSSNTPPTSSFFPQETVGMTPATSDELDLGHYLEILSANKWLVALVTVIVVALGVAYAVLTRPVYESNILIQVEDSDGTADKSFLAEAGSLFNVKTAATSEMEILRSRMILGKAVDQTKLYISASPRYVPLIGGWLARRAEHLSKPGMFGLTGYVSGTERIEVAQFDLPPTSIPGQFIVEAQGEGRYLVQHTGWTTPLSGSVGQLLATESPDGPVEIMITRLDGQPGANFVVNRASRESTIENLQTALVLTERGKASGIISATLQDTNPYRLTEVLNAIGHQYVQQNVERKAAEAQKTLAFLDVQLPQYKRQLEASEQAYNQFREKTGTVAFDEQARLVLGESVDRQTKLLEAQQKRRDLEGRFTANHPTMQALDAQIAALSRDIGGIQSRIKGLPAVQQDAVRLERDVKVNSELYQSLVNNALQLQLVKEGKVGTVRLLDDAVVPRYPVKPKSATIVGMALILGLFLGVAAAFIRSFFVEQRIRDPHEVEANTALPVFTSIPLSGAQEAITKRRFTGATGVRLLAVEHPDDQAVESLRSLRTAMQFAMLEAPNNRVMVTGPTPGVGKSFVTVNFAALMAAAGKRTLLMDADLRRGHQHQYLGLQRHGGLSELIAGSLTVQQTVHRQVVTNLDFLATGQLPPNPAELLESESFRSAIDKLSESYDLIVIDSPPVLVAADAATLATYSGTVLLVARSDVSTMGELRESTRRLALGGKAATGVLLNGMSTNKRGYGTYKYGRYRYTNYNYESVLPDEAAH